MNKSVVLSIAALLMLSADAFSSNKKITVGDLSFELDDKWNWEISRSNLKELQSFTGRSKKLGCIVIVDRAKLDGIQAKRTLQSHVEEMKSYFPDNKTLKESFFTFKNKPAYKRVYVGPDSPKVTHQVISISNGAIYMVALIGEKK